MVANAGHCPLLHYRARDREVIEHNPSGFPLGLGAGEEFHRRLGEKKISLVKGDMLLLYTDGLSEAQDPNGEEFGGERVIKVFARAAKLDAAAAIQRVHREVREFTASDSLLDDITLVAISIK